MSNTKVNQITDDFIKGNVKLWIILHRTADGSGIIEFHHRMCLGEQVLPIPVWLTYEEAYRQLTNWQEGFFDFDKCELVEVNHQQLQSMIDNNQYSSHLAPIIKEYHLDFQFGDLG